MPTIVQARLDERTDRELERLSKQLGWTPSQVVREGISVLAACHGRSPRRRIFGLGEFSSGVSDLGSNKKHLRGFGR
ncbi:MAG TPA: hypothetical protein VFL57_16180 [Bryobacteraceae bacterium]|nr:hypothetical protein [Bryobacteraceae bacterium]